MNVCYDDFRNNISDSRIIEGYFEEIQPKESFWKKACEKSKAILTSSVVRRFAKPVALSVSLLSVGAIIGGIESGRMGLGTGLLVGGLIIAFEALALRGIKRRS